MPDIRVADVGTVLVVTVLDENGDAVDVSAAAVKTILLRKPGGEVLEKTAALDGDGTDGKIRYVTQADDLDRPGRWSIQGYIEVGAGKWHTEIDSFGVGSNVQ